MSVEPVDGSAYTMANAFESFEPRNGVYDVTGRVFNGVSFDDIERFARIVAYKVASNLNNGMKMDPYADPLLYVDCEDYPCLCPIGVFPQPEATGAIGPFDHHGCGEPGGASPEEARGFKLWPSYSHALGCQMNNGRPVIACVCGLPNKSSEGIE